MANNTCDTQDSIFAAILLQLNNQFAQQVIMEQELQSVRSKLDQASRKLAQKDQLIGSLEQDLEHMVDQLTRIKHNHGQVTASNLEALTAVA